MIQKTKHQEFKEWLSSATIDELEEELFTLNETNRAILSQIARYELKIKTEPPTQESEDWRLRSDHSQRWTYYQIKTIERRIVAINQKLDAELKAENIRLSLEEARVKREASDAQNRLTEEAIRLKHERSIEISRLDHEWKLTYDRAFVKAAKRILGADTFMHITNATKESLESTDRQQEE